MCWASLSCSCGELSYCLDKCLPTGKFLHLFHPEDVVAMQRCSVMVSSGIGNNSRVLTRPLRGGHCALWASNVPFVVWSRSKICPLPALCPLITSSNQLNYLTRQGFPGFLNNYYESHYALFLNKFLVRALDNSNILNHLQPLIIMVMYSL